MTDFTFTPEEFQVLEDIEFEEEIQRPEKIRFYTFEEQTADAFDRMLPRGKVTRFQKDKIQYELDTMQNLYNKYVIVTPTDYEIRQPKHGKRLDWVFPMLTTVQLPVYDFRTEIRPIQANRLQRNYYPRLITALPKVAPYGNETPYPLTRPTIFLDSKKQEHVFLPNFETTKTQVHEDKTFDVIRVPIEGSADAPIMNGYFLKKRPLPLPNPLEGHPFLSDNKEKFVETTVPLDDAFPSVEAILNHAVPITKDPYGEGQQYLKLYDIKLADIPWSEWRNRFPPVEVLAEVPIPETIMFPKVNQMSPPEKLIKAYRADYFPGVSGRRWLMDQLDGGELMIRMLLSSSLNNGSVGEIPGVNLPALEYPKTTIAECNLLGLNFQDFTTKGILRRTEKMEYRCVPLEFIRQERARAGYMGRIPWREELSESLLRDYMVVLDQHFPLGTREREPSYEKVAALEDSQLHGDILAILRDDERLTEDKIRDTRELLKDALYSNFTYTDQEGKFVLCDHTLALLNGDLEKDKQLFYNTWTSRIEGSRVCKVCGEHINNDVIDYSDDYDDNENIIKHTDVLEDENKPDESMEVIATFARGLEKIKAIFQEDNAVDDVVYLLLSILQVLPSQDNVLSILQLGRSVSATIAKAKPAAKELFGGIIGIVVTVLILQTHVPFLIPQRSFGPKPLKLNGFPRDSPTPGNYTIVDSLILAIQKTFRNFPSTFKGPSQKLIRAVLKDAKNIRSETIKFFSPNSPFMKDVGVKALLEKAKEQRKQQPVKEEDPATLIPVMAPPDIKELNKVFSYECPTNRPIWNSGRVPPVRQAVVDLRPGIRATTKAAIVNPSVSVRTEPKPIPKKDIPRISKKTIIPLSENYHTNMLLASHLRNIFQLPIEIKPLDPRQLNDELRDYSKGVLSSVLNLIEEDPTKLTRFETLRTKDITIYSILAKFDEEDREMKKARAFERLKFVERLGKKSDMEREIDNDLLQIGLASYVITREDRQMYAKESERIQDLMRKAEEQDEGVGLPRDNEDEETEPHPGGTDNGDYGDYLVLANTDGRDQEQDYLDRNEDDGI